MKAKKKKNKKAKKIVKKVIKKTARKPKKVLIKKKRKAVKKIIKKKLRSPEQDFLAGSFFKAKIKVIGIGGGGGSIVSQISRSLGKASFVVADTDVRAFKKKAGIKNFLFGQSLTHGLGTGVNPQLGRQAAESEKERIKHFFDDQDIVILIASLGGGLGSGATQVFAEAARDFNGITFGIFTLPFKFEGNNKYKIATKALHQLRGSLNVSITIPNEKIFKIIDENTAITDAFSMVNKNLIESLESLIDLIYNPGIINIDFADLRAILNGKGNLAFLNTQEASGKNRAQTIAEKILHNPLYQNNNFTAEKILFNIAGGDNLNMFEVDKISKTINQENPKAKIIFGISKNPQYRNRVKATVLMTGPGREIKIEGEKQNILETANSPRGINGELAVSKTKKVATKKAIKKKKRQHIFRKKTPLENILMPVFDKIPFINEPTEMNIKRLNIVETSDNKPLGRRPLGEAKKAIRRTALEIKKAEEQKENEQSMQEKEWEIPAFLRLKK